MAGTLLVVRWLVSVDAAALVLGVPVAVVAVDQFLGDQAATSGRARSATALGSLAMAGLFAVFWVGSTAPAVTWFGSLTSHGPRNGDEVAITFDDGPNGEDTLAIAAILEQYGVRGTFFLVGKAVEKQPEVARQLIAHGHVTGDHSFHHDAWRYLDPRYPELDRTQRTIQRLAGVCPSFFRPPHGTHTPFMSHVVDSERMSLVTWDVSARDWVEDDPARLARNILAKVRPGSIILLHDGIDGIPGADRSVVVQALPAILDGLRDRGLKPVTLDRLLGKDAYLPAAACGVKEGRGAPEAIRALR
jgi:peptidoglycan/xylan/chitin deacetylase (PgdA/CDA1 family)